MMFCWISLGGMNYFEETDRLKEVKLVPFGEEPIFDRCPPFPSRSYLQQYCFARPRFPCFHDLFPLLAHNDQLSK